MKCPLCRSALQITSKQTHGLWAELLLKPESVKLLFSFISLSSKMTLRFYHSVRRDFILIHYFSFLEAAACQYQLPASGTEWETWAAEEMSAAAAAVRLERGGGVSSFSKRRVRLKQININAPLTNFQLVTKQAAINTDSCLWPTKQTIWDHSTNTTQLFWMPGAQTNDFNIIEKIKICFVYSFGYTYECRKSNYKSHKEHVLGEVIKPQSSQIHSAGLTVFKETYPAETNLVKLPHAAYVCVCSLSDL